LIEIVQNDLTMEKVDAITNAANSNLWHGGGVAGAIVRAGGKNI
jgi:putative ATPase